MLKKIGIILVVIISLIVAYKVFWNLYIDHYYREIIRTELKEKYGEEFVIKKAKYCKSSKGIKTIYYMIVSPKSNKEIKFLVDGRYKNDNYIEQVWNNSIEKEIKLNVEKGYKNSIISADIILMNERYERREGIYEIPKEKVKNIIEVNSYLEEYNEKSNNNKELRNSLVDKEINMKVNIGIFILKNMTETDKKEIEKLRKMLLSKNAKSFLVTVIFIKENGIEYKALKKKLNILHEGKFAIAEVNGPGHRNKYDMYNFFKHTENYKYVNNIVYIDNEGIRYNQKESNVSDVNEEFWKKEENK